MVAIAMNPASIVILGVVVSITSIIAFSMYQLSKWINGLHMEDDEKEDDENDYRRQ